MLSAGLGAEGERNGDRLTLNECRNEVACVRKSLKFVDQIRAALHAIEYNKYELARQGIQDEIEFM